MFRRFVLFQRCLDARMKDGVREGLHIKCKKEEKEFVTAEEERKFWEMNLLQGRNMIYGLRAQSPKYDWDRGS